MPVKKKVKRILKVGREDSSSLASFVERPVPSSGEVNNFERVIGRELREQEIDSNLDEIYKDRVGKRVNVKKMKVKKRPVFLIRFFKYLLLITLLALIAYVTYFYLFSNSNDISSMDFRISSPNRVIAGQEFSYQIIYHNPTKYPFSKLHLELQYPTNFIFSSASISPTSGQGSWNLPNLAAGANFTLVVTGKLIAPPNSTNVIFGYLTYMPSGFTSQFKKETSIPTIVSGPGFNVNLDYSNTAFFNQNNDMTLIFSEVKDNYLGDFNISFSVPNHASASVVMSKSDKKVVSSSTPPVNTGSSSPHILISADGGTNWLISGLSSPIIRQTVPLVYKVTQSTGPVAITVSLEKKFNNGHSYVFWEKTIKPQLVKSDLNLTLLLNGSKNDGSLTFGQTLNYSLSYSNKGNNTYKNVVIMAVAKGDFLDWSSVQANNNGQTQSNTVVWTKNESPRLALIKPGDSGVFNFKVNLLPFKASDLGKSMSVVSYGQYSMNGQPVSGDSNRSNTITNKINSNLSLNEQVRYFSPNNLPVGSGPLPPAVGQTTTFKVYWLVKNSLHELADTRVVLNLPAYVSWSGNNTTNVGSLYYNNVSHQVVWAIGRLPISAAQAQASFSISITPTAQDRNKILVLSPGATITAMDKITTAIITKTTKPQTTKLEDDSIANLNNSGVIQ